MLIDCRDIFVGIVEFVGWCIMDLVIKDQNDWRDVGRPQVAMHRMTAIAIFTARHNADRCKSQSNSVCLSVRPSVIFGCFVQTNEDTIVRFSASGRKIILER